jgi:hypothetical protein
MYGSDSAIFNHAKLPVASSEIMHVSVVAESACGEGHAITGASVLVVCAYSVL